MAVVIVPQNARPLPSLPCSDGTKAGKVIVHNQLGDGQTLKADCYVSGRKIVFLRARYSATDMYRATCKSEVANGALLA